MILAIIALVCGIIFGFALQKSHALRFNTQVNFLLGTDMRLIKCYASAMATGMLGIAILYHFDLLALSTKPLRLAANILGGLIFGIGWACAGYCPITTFASIGEGRLDALWPMIGFLSGGLLFAQVYPWINENIMPIGDVGKLSLADALGISQIAAALTCITGIILFFWWLELPKNKSVL